MLLLFSGLMEIVWSLDEGCGALECEDGFSVKITICPSILQILFMLSHFLVLFQMDEINVQFIISRCIMSAA